MIDSRELRIGNYFNWNDISSVGVGQDTMRFNNMPYYNMMEPIPITKEWLTKLGFGLEGSEMGDKGCMFLPLGDDIEDVIMWLPKAKEMIYRDDLEEDVFVLSPNWGKYYKHIKYVHQLQNLYQSLTGEELTIKQ